MENVDGENDKKKMDDMVLPGFRFHPTDEELVGFYLKRKIQHRTLSIELIKQVDIYKYDPWDLPKFACSGEKEWYFYCPRDRKYRNSARPNRVTTAGFWKATGTDRPIYCSEGTECIGLKKSLVFYRGRAAKGMKTDWMMHEFRLPSSSTSSPPLKHVSDKPLSPNDLWAICRIFKKTNTMTQRAQSRSWESQIHDTSLPDHLLNYGAHYNLFSPEPVSCTTETGSPIHLLNNNDIHCNTTSFTAPEYKPMINKTVLKSYSFPFSTEYLSPLINILNGDIDFQGQQQTTDGVHMDPVVEKQFVEKNVDMDYATTEWGVYSNVLDTWKGDFTWDSPPCPGDMSATFSK